MITAAHCIQEYCIFLYPIAVIKLFIKIISFFVFRKLPQHIEILVGTTKLFSGGTLYKVNETIIHDLYYKETLEYDIALVRPKIPIQFNEFNVQPITYSSKEVPPNAELLASGWGKWTVSKFYEF